MQHNSIARLQQEEDVYAQPQNVQEGSDTKGNGHDMKLVENPPDLAKWRQQLFDVNETITLSEEEYDRVVSCVVLLCLYRCTDTIHTFLMLTTSIPIALLRNTSTINPLYYIVHIDYFD